MSAATPSVAVVGSNVAAMLATLELAKRGVNATLVTPTARLGGHFAGLTVGGKLFDAGMTFLEFTSFNDDPQATVASYDAFRRNDAGRFVTLVARILSQFGAWRDTPTPVMRVGTAVYPDLLIANHLSSLRRLPDELQNAMRSELAPLAANRGPLHASRKTTDPGFAGHDFETVSLANHGRTFHDLFIEPFCRKVTGHSAAQLSALFHRLAWAPLFYPETLLQELEGVSTGLPPTTFSYPTAGTLGSMVRSMESAIRTLPGEHLVEAKITGIEEHGTSGAATLTFGTRTPMQFDHVVWAAEPDQLLELGRSTNPPKATKGGMLLVSALVTPVGIRTEASTMLIPGGDRLPFRVTNQSYAAGIDEELTRLSCEWNPSIATNGVTPEVQGLVRSALVELDIISDVDAIVELRVDLLKEVLPLGTPDNALNAGARFKAVAERFPNVTTIGASAPFGAASLNDQVVQAVQVAEDPRWRGAV